MSGSATTSQPSRLPGIIVASILFAAIALWAGWAIWSHYASPDASQLTEFNPAGPGRGRMAFGPQQPPRPVDGIRQRPNGTLVIRAGEIIANASKDAKGGWDINFRHAGSVMTPAQSAALQARVRLVADAKYAQFLKVTPEQIAQLKPIPAGVPQLVVPDADRAKIQGLLEKYVAASDKSGAENDVVLAVKEATPRMVAATRAELDQRAAKIQQILTPEQFAPFKPQN